VNSSKYTLTTITIIIIIIINDRVQGNTYIGCNLRRALKTVPEKCTFLFMYLEFSYDIEYKNEKVSLKKECVRRLRLVVGTELTLSLPN
jgi:hypothetical protein